MFFCFQSTEERSEHSHVTKQGKSFTFSIKPNYPLASRVADFASLRHFPSALGRHWGTYNRRWRYVLAVTNGSFCPCISSFQGQTLGGWRMGRILRAFCWVNPVVRTPQWLSALCQHQVGNNNTSPSIMRTNTRRDVGHAWIAKYYKCYCIKALASSLMTPRQSQFPFTVNKYLCHPFKTRNLFWKTIFKKK